MVEKALLSEYAPTGVLIDDKYEIMQFIGKTEKYLVPAAGKPSFNLLKMVREDLRYKLTVALYKAVRGKKRTACKGVRIKLNNTVHMVDISISPLTEEGQPPGLLLVIFEEKTGEHLEHEPLGGKNEESTKNLTVTQMEQELQSTREYLQATIEELETSNEELKSTNEEMQSVNEELQSTNEELETSKEELYSTNEELATINAELQAKVDELSNTKDDMKNLLTATDIASIFLNDQFQIKHYTPAAARMINLIPTDIGRPLSDLKTSFPKVDLSKLAQKVLTDLNTLETETLSEDGVWHSLKISPYRTSENVIAGAVVTLIDIQKIKKADKIRRLATILADANDAIYVRDFNGRILAWNKGAESMYGWSETEALKMTIESLIPNENLKVEQTFMSKLKKGESTRTLKTRRITKSGRYLNIWLTATILTDEHGQPSEIATTERDLAWLPTGSLA